MEHKLKEVRPGPRERPPKLLHWAGTSAQQRAAGHGWRYTTTGLPMLIAHGSGMSIPSPLQLASLRPTAPQDQFFAAVEVRESVRQDHKSRLLAAVDVHGRTLAHCAEPKGGAPRLPEGGGPCGRGSHQHGQQWRQDPGQLRRYRQWSPSSSSSTDISEFPEETQAK